MTRGIIPSEVGTVAAIVHIDGKLFTYRRVTEPRNVPAYRVRSR